MDDKKVAVRGYWGKPSTISLVDENLRELETQAILKRLKTSDSVLDVGCGDGINSLVYAGRVERLIGVDYSEEMIRRAKRRVAELNLVNVGFQNLAVQQLSEIHEDFSVVITQRCLINLTSFEEQREAILSIHRLLQQGGLYLMLECVEQGRALLNDMRVKMGVPPIPMPWHNQFFDIDQLISMLRQRFSLVETIDFSLYFLITRLLNPLIGHDHTDWTSKQIDSIARELQLQLGLDQLKGIGPQRLFVLRKSG
jgi:ubiquinone/menaquinone biosynthesis C-methylase UbiE